MRSKNAGPAPEIAPGRQGRIKNRWSRWPGLNWRPAVYEKYVRLALFCPDVTAPHPNAVGARLCCSVLLSRVFSIAPAFAPGGVR